MITCKQLSGNDIITHYTAQCFPNLILFSQLCSSLRFKKTKSTNISPLQLHPFSISLLFVDILSSSPHPWHEYAILCCSHFLTSCRKLNHSIIHCSYTLTVLWYLLKNQFIFVHIHVYLLGQHFICCSSAVCSLYKLCNFSHIVSKFWGVLWVGIVWSLASLLFLFDSYFRHL